MLRRLLLTFALVFLFGLGQQEAAVHAISHFADWQENQQQDNKSHHAPTCDKCVTYAELGSAVGSQPFALPALQHRYHQHAWQEASAGCAPTAAYSARAPPHLA